MDWEQLYNENYFDPQYVEIDRILAIEGEEAATDVEQGKEEEKDDQDKEGEEMEQAGKEKEVGSVNSHDVDEGVTEMDMEPATEGEAEEGAAIKMITTGGEEELQDEVKERPPSPGGEPEGKNTEEATDERKVAEQLMEVVEVADSEASDTKMEKSGKERRYLVKWCGLGYGER